MKVFKRIGNELMDRVRALKKAETYLYLLSGFLMIAGLLLPAVNFVFYLTFVYPVYKICRREQSRSGLFYYLLPYFLVVGIGEWNRIFPFLTGILLAVLLADLIALLMNLAVSKIDLKSFRFLWLAALLFLFDYAFHNLPYLRMISMPSLMAPLYNHSFVLGAASAWGGYLTLLFIMVMVSAIAAMIAERKVKPAKAAALAAAAALTFMPLLLATQPGETVKTVRVAAVQGSYRSPEETPDDYLAYLQDHFDYYTALAEEIDADIIVFPEFEMGVYDNQNLIDAQFRDEMAAFAKEKDALALFTVTEGNSVSKRKEERFIASLLVSNEGIAGITRKRNLVPIGETGRYSPGTDYPVLDTADGRIGVSICYDINAATVERLKEGGAQIILAPFNDSGFGPVFHRVHRFDAIIQAAVCRIPIVMANENGISQMIDENGAVICELGIGDKGVLTHTFALRPQRSYYLLFGRYAAMAAFGAIILGIAVLGIWAGRRAKGRKKEG